MTSENVDSNVIITIFEDKNEIEKVEYVGDLIFDKQKYKYNNGNKITEEINLSENGDIYFTIKKLYDEKGYIIKTSMLDDNENTITTKNYEYTKYDENGNWKELLISENDSLKILIESKIIYRK